MAIGSASYRVSDGTGLVLQDVFRTYTVVCDVINVSPVTVYSHGIPYRMPNKRHEKDQVTIDVVRIVGWL